MASKPWKIVAGVAICAGFAIFSYRIPLTGAIPFSDGTRLVDPAAGGLVSRVPGTDPASSPQRILGSAPIDVAHQDDAGRAKPSPNPALGSWAASNHGSQQQRVADTLPQESAILLPDGLSVEQFEAIASSDRFSSFIDSLAGESASDPLASDLQTLYGDAIADQLGEELRLQRFACGLRICVGMIDGSAGGEAFGAWEEAFANDPRTPFHSFGVVPITTGSGLSRWAVVFGTDESSGALVIPP